MTTTNSILLDKQTNAKTRQNLEKSTLIQGNTTAIEHKQYRLKTGDGGKLFRPLCVVQGAIGQEHHTSDPDKPQDERQEGCLRQPLNEIESKRCFNSLF